MSKGLSKPCALRPLSCVTRPLSASPKTTQSWDRHFCVEITEVNAAASRQAGWFAVLPLTCHPWNEGSLEGFCLDSLSLPAKLSFQVLLFFLNKRLRAGL